MRKWMQLAASWTLYGVGHLAFLLIEKIGLMNEERDEPPWYHSVLFQAYQWCMVTSSHLDEWDVLWKPPIKAPSP